MRGGFLKKFVVLQGILIVLLLGAVLYVYTRPQKQPEGEKPPQSKTAITGEQSRTEATDSTADWKTYTDEYGFSFKYPKDFSLDIQTSLVKRVGMIKIKNVKIVKSPSWLSEKLVSYGIESKNNIVDLTNLVMVETGEPMHAFDLDKIGNSLEIRLAKDGEKITTFQDTTLTLTKDDLVWAKKNNILSVAGSIGEKYNSVSDTTKNILLEAANYDRANIRKTVYRHNLLTDAGIRHEKERHYDLDSIDPGSDVFRHRTRPRKGSRQHPGGPILGLGH